MPVKKDGWAVFGKMVAIIALIALGSILRGLVLSVLWAWFVQPLGVTDIGIAEAIGLMTIVGLATMRADPDEDQKKRPPGERFAEAIGVTIVGSGFALAMGYLVHLFV